MFVKDQPGVARTEGDPTSYHRYDGKQARQITGVAKSKSLLAQKLI